jgi:hypothetical protein
MLLPGPNPIRARLAEENCRENLRLPKSVCQGCNEFLAKPCSVADLAH